MTTTTDDIRRQQGHQQHDTRTMTSLAVSIKPKNTTGAAVLLRLLAMATSLALPLATNATFIYEVSPYGEPYSLAGALAEAGPGDIVSLANGTYDEPLVTVAGGEDGNPLVIEGGPEAVFNAYTGDRDKVVYVQHSWVTLRVRSTLSMCRSTRRKLRHDYGFMVGTRYFCSFETFEVVSGGDPDPSTCGVRYHMWLFESNLYLLGGELCCSPSNCV